jgi:hypothetical protein
VNASAVVVDRGPFSDFPRNYPERKPSSLLNRREAIRPNHTEKGTVAIGFLNPTTSLKEVRGCSELIPTKGFRNLTNYLKEVRSFFIHNRTVHRNIFKVFYSPTDALVSCLKKQY